VSSQRHGLCEEDPGLVEGKVMTPVHVTGGEDLGETGRKGGWGCRQGQTRKCSVGNVQASGFHFNSQRKLLT
jgi:hypothetical protein